MKKMLIGAVIGVAAAGIGMYAYQHNKQAAGAARVETSESALAAAKRKSADGGASLRGVAMTGAALLISQIRPTFAGPAALREVTGLNVLGTVAMSRTEGDRARLRRGQLMLGLSLCCLLGMYGAALTAGMLAH